MAGKAVTGGEKAKKEPVTEVKFKCRLCEKEKPITEMKAITRFRPAVVVCRDCEGQVR